MKLVTAVVKPFKLDDVRETLSDIMQATVTEVKASAVRRGIPSCSKVRNMWLTFYRSQTRSRHNRRPGGSSHRSGSKAANTGKIGDGKIFVVNLEQAIRIRTGESGNEAL